MPKFLRLPSEAAGGSFSLVTAQEQALLQRALDSRLERYPTTPEKTVQLLRSHDEEAASELAAAAAEKGLNESKREGMSSSSSAAGGSPNGTPPLDPAVRRQKRRWRERAALSVRHREQKMLRELRNSFVL